MANMYGIDSNGYPTESGDTSVYSAGTGCPDGMHLVNGTCVSGECLPGERKNPTTGACEPSGSTPGPNIPAPTKYKDVAPPPGVTDLSNQPAPKPWDPTIVGVTPPPSYKPTVQAPTSFVPDSNVPTAFTPGRDVPTSFAPGMAPTNAAFNPYQFFLGATANPPVPTY